MSHYLFIDGASFENSILNICSQIFDRYTFPDIIDFERLAYSYDRLFYYDSLPAKSEKQTDEEYQIAIQQKQDLFNKINETNKCHVHSAMSRYRKKRGQEQKGVDILLAIDVMQHSYRGNIELASIITNDLDFLPLFDALTQTKVRTVLIYRPPLVSKELVQSADFSKTIHCTKLAEWCNWAYREQFLVSKAQINQRRPLDLQNIVIDVDGRLFIKAKFKDTKFSDYVVLVDKDEFDRIGNKCKFYSSKNEKAILLHIKEEKWIKSLD